MLTFSTRLRHHSAIQQFWLRRDEDWRRRWTKKNAYHLQNGYFARRKLWKFSPASLLVQGKQANEPQQRMAIGKRQRSNIYLNIVLLCANVMRNVWCTRNTMFEVIIVIIIIIIINIIISGSIIIVQHIVVVVGCLTVALSTSYYTHTQSFRVFLVVSIIFCLFCACIQLSVWRYFWWPLI